MAAGTGPPHKSASGQSWPLTCNHILTHRRAGAIDVMARGLVGRLSNYVSGIDPTATYWEVAEAGMAKTSVLENTPRSGGTSLDLTGFAGLSEADARGNIERDGPNEIASPEKRGLFAIVIEVVREPMFLMLVAAGSLYLLMGSPGDALMLLGFVFVVMGITIVQERRTERALDALRDLSSPRALVIRGGVRRRVAGREVARGDILVLSEGDRVPADAISGAPSI
jgi:magnesium-transporting ATPase (P-type)